MVLSNLLIFLDVPEETPEALLIALGITSTLTVCCMVLSFMLNSLVLVGILKAFDINNPQSESFRQFWDLRCDEDFKKAFGFFTLGVPLFMINLVIASWIKFNKQKTMCSFITVIVGLSLFMWHIMYRKWGSFLVSKDNLDQTPTVIVQESQQNYLNLESQSQTQTLDSPSLS